MINPVPERLTNFKVYQEGVIDLIGIATVDLPDIEVMTDTVSGAGIAGEIDSPVIGHFGSMSLTINWRTIQGNATALNAPRAHHLEFRGSQQVYESATGTYFSVPVRVVAKCVPKNFSMGSLEVGATTDSSSEFEVMYLKVFIANIPRIEIDKYNFKFEVDGVNYLAGVKADLGMF